MDAGPPSLAPADVDTMGLGACERTALRTVVQRVYRANPELSDITEFVPNAVYGAPEPDASASFFEAAMHPTTVELSFRRCSGEVVDGECTDATYWYFETDAACEPQLVGQYHQSLNGDCFEVEGEPRVGFRGIVNKRSLCDFDFMPMPLPDRSVFTGLGEGTFCGIEAPALRDITVEVSQRADDPSQATVVFTGLGSCVDGQDLPARVLGSTVELDAELGEALPECGPPDRISATMSFAGEPLFGGGFTGYIEHFVQEAVCESSATKHTGSFHLLPAAGQ
jgi:phage tail protein X